MDNKTFIKGLLLLETLARSDGPRGVTDLSRELHLTKTNVYRLLQTLLKTSYVRQVGTNGQYELTMKVWEIGSAYIGRLDVKRIAPPFLKQLAKLTQETVNLSVLDQLEVVYIDKIDSPQPVRAHSQVGGRAPAYFSSTGKAMLAFHPTATRLLPKVVHRLSDGKAITREAIMEELAAAHKHGYAMNTGDMSLSVRGLGSPIFDADASVVAAVGVAGPAERMTDRVIRKFAPLVRKTADQISAALGRA